MIELIKSLYNKRDRDLLVMIVDPSDTGEPKEFRLHSTSQSRWFYAAIIGTGCFAVLFLVLLILRWTAGGDARIRMEINQLAGRVSALSDSVEVRDRQLTQIRSTLSGGLPNVETNDGERLTNRTPQPVNGSAPTQRQGGEEVVFPTDWSRLDRTMTSRPIVRSTDPSGATAATFPAKLPVSGRITRSYHPALGHFGTDVAVREGTVLRNIATGMVMSSDWTIPYGFVVAVTHEDGFVIVYKHLITSDVQTGQLLQKGDKIGTVGMAGTLSSGPHLHIELWKNGSHIDPMIHFWE